jgi:hypothetical protein
MHVDDIERSGLNGNSQGVIGRDIAARNVKLTHSPV